jgi:hypothetical protein
MSWKSDGLNVLRTSYSDVDGNSHQPQEEKWPATGKEGRSGAGEDGAWQQGFAAEARRRVRRRSGGRAVGVGAHEAKAFHSNLAIKSSFMLPQNAEIDVISAF